MAKQLSTAFRPLFDRILIQRAEVAAKTAGGILLPTAPKVNEGVVIAVGTGIPNQTGKNFPMNINVGDKVLLPDFGGVKMSFSDKDAMLFRYDEILGVIHE